MAATSEKIIFAGVPFSDTKKTMQQYWHEQGKGAEFDAALENAKKRYAALPQEIAPLATQVKETEEKLKTLNPESDAYKETKAELEALNKKKKPLDDLLRGLKRNLPRHIDPNIGLDASAAALVCIGVRGKDGTVKPYFMVYESARKDWVGCSLVAINGKIEKDELDPRETMCREVREELLNSPLGLDISTKVQRADMNQAPKYFTDAIGLDRVTTGKDCYLNQTTFVFGGIYDEDELNEELKGINASMEKLLGNDTAPASLFIKHVQPGPFSAVACKDPVLAEKEILTGLNALLAWHDEKDPIARCPLTAADYAALTELRNTLNEKRLDLSNPKDVAIVKKIFEEHVYCYTEAKGVRLISENELHKVADNGNVMTAQGKVQLKSFIQDPLQKFFAEEEKAAAVVSNDATFGRPGSPTHFQPAPVRRTPAVAQWLEREIATASILRPGFTQ